MRRTLTQTSASAAPSHHVEEDLFPMFSSRPPTLSQLAALTAMPSGMMTNSRAQARKPKKAGKRQRLAREGQIVSVTFDSLGRRPFPTNGIGLEQSIQIELLAEIVPNFLMTSTTPGVYSFAGQTFIASAFSGAANLLTVFDQYRFDQIEVWLECTVPNKDVSFPDLTSAVDLDDANTPVNIGQVQDHQGALMTGGPAGHYHKWKPHVAIAAFSGAFTSYSNAESTWIDAASPSVQHFGFKAAALSNAPTAVSYNLVARAVMSFRAPAIS